jgi:hypothetical protein
MGLVFSPSGESPWMNSHAACPFPQPLGGDAYRIYFSPRDLGNRSSVGYIDIDIKTPTRLLNVSPEPVLEAGELGAFDDSGASLGCLVESAERTYLYYLGWNLGVTVSWRNSIGLAVREHPSTTFQRVSRAPVLDRSSVDPFTLTYPWVLREPGVWRMWYGSHITWGSGGKDWIHILKYAQSLDGRLWQPIGPIDLAFVSQDESALTKPCVIKEANIYKMWFSAYQRNGSYKIGYAESEDGIHWRRLDDACGLSPSGTGFDSESVEYGTVFDHSGRRYMVYNGNGYGRTGFGLAVLTHD